MMSAAVAITPQEAEELRDYTVTHTFDRDFVNCLNRINRKYGDGVFEVLGIASKNLDIVRFSEEFFGNSVANVADLSIDDNANVSEKNISHYDSESTKALQKLNSLSIMYSWVKKCFSKKDADVSLDKVISGEIFVSDLTCFSKPYCFAFDLRNLLYEGMSFFKGNFKILPPKRTSSYVAQLIQSIAYISNQIVGACMHKDQKIIVKDSRETIKDFTSKDLFHYFSNLNSFSFKMGDSVWDRIDISNSNFRIWENNKFVDLKSVFRRSYSEPIFMIKTASGKNIKVSKDHIFKVFYRDREIEVPAKDLKVYDTLVNTELLKIPLDKESYDYRFGQALGIFCGDGCLTQQNSLQVSCNSRQGFIASFLDDFFLEFFGKKGVWVQDTRGNCFSWLLHSKSIKEKFLQNFSSIDGTLYHYSKYVDLKDKSLNFKAGYLDGLLVTEGSWNNSYRLGLTNKKLIDSVSTICNDFGIETTQSVVPAKGSKKELFNICIPFRINAILKIMHCRFVNNSRYLSCLEKNKGEISYLGKYFPHSFSSSNLSNLYQKGFCSSGEGSLKNTQISSFKTDVVVSIEQEENDHGFVYEVETSTGWYSCGGVLTHNCSFPDALVIWNYFLQKEYGVDFMSRIDSDPEMKSEILNQFQNFIYSANFPFRSAGQSAFVNLSVLDRGFMTSLFTREGVSGQDYLFPDGSKVDIDSSIALSKLFFEYYTKINSEEGIFTFPVMTLAISKDSKGNFIDPEFVDWVSKANSEKCLGNIFLNKPTSFSSCCRLLNNFENISTNGYSNSFGVGSLGVGSHRCAGLNLPRLAILEKTNPNAFDEALDSVHCILYAHRKLLEHNISVGSMPLYTTNWISLKRQYSTIGFVGMYEYLRNKDLNPTDSSSIKIGVNLLKKVEDKILFYQKNFNTTINLEQIPAESFAVRLAKLDTLLGFNPNNFLMYSNQYLPLWEDQSIYDRFRLQGCFDSHTSGGAILHINVADDKSLSPIQFRALIEHARISGTTYFAINLAFSECINKHFSVGQKEICPVCSGNIVNCYTRVVGYLSRVGAWNKTRRNWDFPNRHFYKNEKLEEKQLGGETENSSV